MPAGYETITVEKRGPVDWLTLNRPEVLNAISVDMVRELDDYFGRLYDDRETRVVMRGAGRAFCAGLDIKDRAGRDPGAVPFGGGFGFQGFSPASTSRCGAARSLSLRWSTGQRAAAGSPLPSRQTSASRARACG